MTAETVDRRLIPRYRGEPVTHEVRWRGAHAGERFYPGGLVGECDCGQWVHATGGYITERLPRGPHARDRPALTTDLPPGLHGPEGEEHHQVYKRSTQ